MAIKYYGPIISLSHVKMHCKNIPFKPICEGGAARPFVLTIILVRRHSYPFTYRGRCPRLISYCPSGNANAYHRISFHYFFNFYFFLFFNWHIVKLPHWHIVKSSNCLIIRLFFDTRSIPPPMDGPAPWFPFSLFGEGR